MKYFCKTHREQFDNYEDMAQHYDEKERLDVFCYIVVEVESDV